jgi:hypothetical protein
MRSPIPNRSTLIAEAHTTRDAELDGATIPGAAVIAHTNSYFAGLRYPDQVFTVEPHHTVRLR